MKVLIVGGGVAGCTTAALLKKYGVADVTLVEKTPEFRNIGYLIGFWGAGRKIMQELGIESVLNEKGFEYKEDIIRNEKGRLMKIMKMDALMHHGAAVVMRRADVHRALYELLSDMDIRFNTSVSTMLQEPSGVMVEFSDGKKERFDVVVGADGIHSNIREKVFGSGFLSHYGWGAWMWWMPDDYEAPINPIGYYGRGKICALAPFFGKSAAFAIATVPPGTGRASATRHSIIQRLFSDFCDDARKIIATAPSAENIYYDDISEIEMPLWYKGRVLLIGDAQHAVSPVTGMGASMAMEDASVLVDELRKEGTIDQALARFATRREPRIRHFRKLVDHADGWVMVGGLLGFLRNLFLAYVPEWYFTNMVDKFLREKV